MKQSQDHTKYTLETPHNNQKHLRRLATGLRRPAGTSRRWSDRILLSILYGPKTFHINSVSPLKDKTTKNLKSEPTDRKVKLAPHHTRDATSQSPRREILLPTAGIPESTTKTTRPTPPGYKISTKHISCPRRTHKDKPEK